MMLLAALTLAAQVAPDDLTLDAPPLDWTTDHAPYGMDVTFDGKVWINTNREGARDDYAILANDLYKALTAHSSNPRLWIRGYHLRNREVTYRETKTLVSIDCVRDTIWIERKLYYKANGDLIASTGPFASEPVVPGSIGESWRKFACAS
jgi:hypothetical protein